MPAARISVCLVFCLVALHTNPVGAAPCVVPVDEMVITEDTTFCPGSFYLPNGITILGDGITVSGNGTTISGADAGYGVQASGAAYLTVQDLTVTDYFHGLHFHNCDGVTIDNCNVWDTPELPEGTIFLDIFDGPNGEYAHAMWLRYCDDAVVTNNDVSDQQNGISLFECERPLVDGNYASYNTGWGIYCYNVDHGTVTNNTADYCTRDYYGWSGADAASFLIVYGSDYNTVTDNSFVGGGDGVFLAGATHTLAPRPNNHNYFARNDCSDSPNNGFEATFSEYNVFEDNISDGCNYGYWMGYSANSTVRKNRANDCRTAGVAIEHGNHNTIEGNTFNGSDHGIMLWTDEDSSLVGAFPDRRDSYAETVRNNTLIGNDRGIYCYATGSQRFSFDHTIVGNVIDENTRGVVLSKSNNNLLHTNHVRNNINVGIELGTSTGNTIYNNYLANTNNATASQAQTWHAAAAAGPNILGGPWLGGNYWSDYAGGDTDLDGIGDTAVPHTSGGSIAGGDGAPLLPTLILGDLNCDEAVDVFDIDPFVMVLLNPAAYATQYPQCSPLAADLNYDGVTDVFDINPFVDLLLSE